MPMVWRGWCGIEIERTFVWERWALGVGAWACAGRGRGIESVRACAAAGVIRRGRWALLLVWSALGALLVRWCEVPSVASEVPISGASPCCIWVEKNFGKQGR